MVRHDRARVTRRAVSSHGLRAPARRTRAHVLRARVRRAPCAHGAAETTTTNAKARAPTLRTRTLACTTHARMSARVRARTHDYARLQHMRACGAYDHTRALFIRPRRPPRRAQKRADGAPPPPPPPPAGGAPRCPVAAAR
jgi:hypothetical protein